MVAPLMKHPLAERDIFYWTDLKDERFEISLRDPGPETQAFCSASSDCPVSGR